MKHALRRVSYFVAAMAAAAGVSNASAGGDNAPGDNWSPAQYAAPHVTLHNHTNGCVRTYINGRNYDTYPWKDNRLAVGRSVYKVDIFWTSTCGGRAVKTMWFGTNAGDWHVWR